MPVPAGGSPTAVAIGDSYITLEELKAYLKIDESDTTDDALLTDALASATQEIDDVCGRQFGRDEVASIRIFEAIGSDVVFVDDFWSPDDLAVSVAGSAWTVDTDFRLSPYGGMVRGRPWPYNRISVYGTRTSWGYATTTGPARISVTAKWGWPEVPAPVREACKIAAAETFSLKDARFGVAGFGQYGELRVRVNPMIMAKLRPYILDPAMVA